LVFVVNPLNDIFKGNPISVKDFNDKTLLLSKSDCSYRMIFEKMLLEANVKLNKTIEVNSPEALKKMLLTGCTGIALLPLVAVERELSDGSLISLKWKGPAFNAKLYMIWKKEQYQTEVARAFVDTVRASFGKN